MKNLFLHCLGAKGAHCTGEVFAFAQLWNPAPEMFADVIGKATENHQNCRKLNFSLSVVFMIEDSIYTLYLSGFFIHCLLVNAHEIEWSGRWHRGLEGCGVMCRGCGELSAGSHPVSFPCLLSVTELFNGACDKPAQKGNG